MDDFSIESLYEMGLGLKTHKSTSVSIEKWDGDRDALAYEMASAESMLDMMDVFSRMSKLNSVQKIKCANRINANYGHYNRGIESYCCNVIQSAEVNINSDSVYDVYIDTDSPEFKAIKAKTTSKKKDAWYKTLFKIIKDFFVKLWELICSIPSRLKAFAKRIFSKKEKKSSSNNSSSDSSSSSSSSNSSSDSSSSNNSNTNSNGLSENALQYKKNFENIINAASENIQDVIKEIKGSHEKLLSLIKKIEESEIQDKQSLSIFSNCCKIISECYRIFIKGSSIHSSFCKDFLDSFDDDSPYDKRKLDAIKSKTSARFRGRELKNIMDATCVIGGDVLKSEFNDSKIKEGIHNGSAVDEKYDPMNIKQTYNNINNDASSFIKGITNYVRDTFDYDLLDANNDINNELLKKDPDEFFRKLLSLMKKLETDTKAMDFYMEVIYGLAIGEDRIGKYLG